MYHKVMMQIYLPEDVCKKLYKKIYLQVISFKKITKKKSSKKKSTIDRECHGFLEWKAFAVSEIVCYFSRRASAN